MIYYFPSWNITLFAIPGTENKRLIQYFIQYYPNKDEIKRISPKYDIWRPSNITNLPIWLSIQNSIKIGFIRNPLYRMYNIYNNISEYPALEQIPHETLDQFISIIYQNGSKIFSNHPEYVKAFSLLHPQIISLSTSNNLLPFDIVIRDDDMTTQNVSAFITKLSLRQSNQSQLLKDLSNMMPVDYMADYSEDSIKMMYLMYHMDYNHFNFPLYKLPKSMIPIPPLNRNQKPIFTIITPTMGNHSIIRLKKALLFEDIPFIHLILWDTNRVNNEVDIKSLEDERTFCYEFKHPYHQFPKQRNDVWLRAVGITLTNTPFITFFDDDTWPERNHLKTVFDYMTSNKLDYTYCQRRMWEDSGIGKDINSSSYQSRAEYDCEFLRNIGVDTFEATGEKNKFGYTLIDNSSLYLRLETGRKLSSMFMGNQVYGDDRLTKDFLEDNNTIGKKLEHVLVNHVAKPNLVDFFRENVDVEI